MRFHIPFIILILLGVLATDGIGRQITSLPPLTSEQRPPEAAQIFRSLPVVKPANSTGSVEETAADLGKFDDAFESALLQFPQQRTARLPLASQEPARTSEGPQSLDRLTIRNTHSL